MPDAVAARQYVRSFCYGLNPVHTSLLSDPFQINKKTYMVQGEFCFEYNIAGVWLCQDASLSKPRMLWKLVLMVR